MSFYFRLHSRCQLVVRIQAIGIWMISNLSCGNLNITLCGFHSMTGTQHTLDPIRLPLNLCMLYIYSLYISFWIFISCPNALRFLSVVCRLSEWWHQIAFRSSFQELTFVLIQFEQKAQWILLILLWFGILGMRVGKNAPWAVSSDNAFIFESAMTWLQWQRLVTRRVHFAIHLWIHHFVRLTWCHLWRFDDTINHLHIQPFQPPIVSSPGRLSHLLGAQRALTSDVARTNAFSSSFNPANSHNKLIRCRQLSQTYFRGMKVEKAKLSPFSVLGCLAPRPTENKSHEQTANITKPQFTSYPFVETMQEWASMQTHTAHGAHMNGNVMMINWTNASFIHSHYDCPNFVPVVPFFFFFAVFGGWFI